MVKNITFNLPAEAMQGVNEAIVLGDFNSWNPENAPKLEKQKDGSFNTVLALEAGKTYQYRFLLDNTRWVNDYNAQRYQAVPGYGVENSVITIPVAEEKKNEKPTVKKTVAKKTEKTTSTEAEKPATAKAPKKATSKVKVSETEAPKSVKAKAPKAEKPAKSTKKA